MEVKQEEALSLSLQQEEEALSLSLFEGLRKKKLFLPLHQALSQSLSAGREGSLLRDSTNRAMESARDRLLGRGEG